MNREMKLETFRRLYGKVVSHFNTEAKNIYVFDGYCGANPASRKKARHHHAIYMCHMT